MKLSEIYSKNNTRTIIEPARKEPVKQESSKGPVKRGPVKKPVISIEIFPPKAQNDAEFQTKMEKLFDELKVLNKNFKPSLISITYGAGGSKRDKSNLLTKEIKNNFDFDIVMPHFTCVCSSKSFIKDYLDEIKTLGIKNILALRGDEPEDIEVCYKDFKFASELVEFIKAEGGLEIAVAGYPEGHILSPSIKEDVKNLKNKVNKGASAIFTQFFFENEKFYDYLEILDKNNINLPVIAGLLPVISYEGLTRMVHLSGIKLSKKAINHFEKWQYSKEDTIKAGIEWTSIQAEDLIKNKADGIHFYSLNKARSTVEILKNVSC